jgi:hypothetical protein
VNGPADHQHRVVVVGPEASPVDRFDDDAVTDDVDPQFLGELAHGGHLPRLPGSHDATGCDVPPARPDVLVRTPPVDEQTAVGMLHREVDGAVTQPPRAHLTTRDQPEHAAVAVDLLHHLVTRGTSHRHHG